MNVVRHQAPPQHRDLVACALDAQRFEITPAVIVIQENVLAVIASLGDVMRCADRHHPRSSGHGKGYFRQPGSLATILSHVAREKVVMKILY